MGQWEEGSSGVGLMYTYGWWLGFPGGSVGKNPPAILETQFQSLGRDDSSVLAWRIP